MTVFSGMSAPKRTILIRAFCSAAIFVLLSALPRPASASEAPERIVSLAPSLTEILYALGLGDRIVGVADFSDYPEEAKLKPRVGGHSNPSLELILSMRPDIVLMTTDGNPKELQGRLDSLGIRTHVTRARGIRTLADGIRELGEVLGEPERAGALAARMEREIAEFQTDVKAPLKILFIIWPEPLLAAGPGTTIDDAIGILGHRNIAFDSPMPYPKLSLEEVIRRRPDVIVIGKGHGIRESSEGLLRRLASVPAVKEGRVYYVSDKLYRVGPRIVDGLRELRDALSEDGAKEGGER